jgi:acetyltransferase-like isoleucine patch superfamily enzyme
VKKLKLSFNSAFFEHMSEIKEKETGNRSSIYDLISRLLKLNFFAVTVWLIENFLAFLLWLPIPIYSTFMFRLINNARGLPKFHGMYFRALYYRFRLYNLESNVLIDRNVTFAFPSAVSLCSFCYIDKNVMIMAKKTDIGRRVHLAPNVFISGGGYFVAKDFSCVAVNSVIITSTETLKNGSRSSGPMTKVNQREVVRGKVVLEKDAFVGAGATILPNVTVGQGSVIGAGAIISKSTEPWTINVAARNSNIGNREIVKY